MHNESVTESFTEGPAAVEAAPGPAPTADELKTLVRQELPHHHVPVAIVVTDQLPRNPSLEVSLADVAALYPLS